ncbi:MAG: DUF1800 family protein [Candidatus Absconditabacterales bacterium]|nr:DUF1800 family protein [Candidatus Absconditabacterales bacterium]
MNAFPLTLFALCVNIVILIAWTPTYASIQSTWTRDDALHLARKVLFHPTPAIVDQLTAAGSASGAVALLFPNQDGPAKTQMDNAITALMAQPGFVLEGWSNNPWANRYYQTMLALDPYEAKAKLSLLWYDIFAVNREGDVRISDIVDQQRLLYSYTLGNYKTMVQRHMFNNSTPLGTGQGGRGDYAVGRFIDLLHQNVNFPNENYARELLQLFLMGEYDILDTPGQAKPNYTDEDVIALAKKLTGLEADPVSHQVRFNPNQRNMSSGLQLLSGSLAPGYTPAMFPYRDPATDRINLAQAHVSISGNNGLFDNTINYIFAKREATIARYVAYLLYKFYVDDRVKLNNVVGDARTHIQELANQFIANKYEILPTIQWLLTREWMYSPAIKNVPQKKTPVELAIGTIKALTHRMPSTTSIHTMNADLLTELGRIPFYPGSIFGRDGFDNADIWINDYIVNRRIMQATNFAFNTITTHRGSPKIDRTGRFEILGTSGTVVSGGLLRNVPSSAEEYLDTLETLFLGSPGILPSGVRSHIINYMIGDGTPFDPSNSGFVNRRMRGAIALILMQPEYLLKQGHTSYNTSATLPTSIIAGPNKIVFLELFGGYDRIYGIVPQDQYMRYVADRTILAVPFSQMHARGVHLFNNRLKPLSDLIASNELITIHGVGNPGHSRGHDTAQRQSVSAYNRQEFGTEGLFGHLIKNDSPANTFVIGLNKPNIFSHGQYTNIGPGSSMIQFAPGWETLPSEAERNRIIAFMTGSLASIHRSESQYQGQLRFTYAGAIKLDEVARKPGPNAASRQLSGQLAYINKLLDNNMGHAFYAVGGHGFDTHAGQQADDVLNNKIDSFARDIRFFFDQAKTKGHNVTIVVHTEFGRTIKRNGSDGTDHGEGGGYFIVSNNVNVQQAFPKKSYGRIDLINTKRDRLGVGIDYRAVYRRIFEALYGITPAIVAQFDLEQEIDTTPPRFVYTHMTFGAQSDRNVRATINANIEDVNYRPVDMASHVRAAWGTGRNNLVQEDFWNTSRYIIQPNGNIVFTRQRQGGGERRFFGLTGMDNQHITTFITGELKTPHIRPANQFVYNDTGNHLIFRAYEQTRITGSFNLETPILIPADTYRLTNESPTLRVPSNTQIVSLEGSGARSGAVLLPYTINPSHFVSASAQIGGMRMRDAVVNSLIAVGPDTRGIGATLTLPVDIIIPTTVNATYDIYYSRDGENRTLHTTTGTSNNTVTIKTTQLGYFALINSQAVACELIMRQLPGSDGTNYRYAIDVLGKNATSWTLRENGAAIGTNTAISGSVERIIMPNISYVYEATVTNGSATNTCSGTINHVVTLSAPAPSCTLTHTKNTDGSYTLARTFVGGNPLAATIAGNQDVGDITNLSVRTQKTVPPVNALTTYTLTTRGIGDEKTCSTVIDTRTTTPAPGGGRDSGGGGGGLRMDVCPSGDNSPSYYDGLCNPISQVTAPIRPTQPQTPSQPNPPRPGVGSSSNQAFTGMTQAQKNGMDRLIREVDRRFQNNPKQYTMFLNRIISIANTRYTQTPGTEQRNYLRTLAESRLRAQKTVLTRPTTSNLVAWMYKHGFTKYNTIAEFRPQSAITREQMARMVVMADMMHNPTKVIKNTRQCTFEDASQIDPTLIHFVRDACQRGLMQGSAGKFMPKQRLTYAQATAVMDRILNGERQEGNPRWAVYMNAARSEGYLPRDRKISSPGVNEALNRGMFGELLYNAAIIRNKE